MSAMKAAGLSVLGFVLGGIVGGFVGLGGGLLFTTVAGTSGFEGYSGFVVGYWILGGLLLGFVVGSIFGVRWDLKAG